MNLYLKNFLYIFCKSILIEKNFRRQELFPAASKRYYKIDAAARHSCLSAG